MKLSFLFLSFLLTFNGFAQSKQGNVQQPGESLMLDWPDSEQWQVGSNQTDKNVELIELVRKPETVDNWTEFGSMMSIKGMVNIPPDVSMNMMFKQAKANSDNAKLTFIEKDEKAKFPWIIFKIETSSFKTDNKPESQLYFIIQGKTALYTNFWAVKSAAITETQKKKWVAFFKSGKVVNM